MADSSWTSPGAFPVAPGVHRIPLPLPGDGLRAVNVYAVEGDDGLVLIDGGWSLAQSREQLRSALESIGHRLSDISAFYVTHIHRDHYTQAVALRREVGSVVALGEGERRPLEALRETGTGWGVSYLRYLESLGAHRLVRRMRELDPGHGIDLTDWEMPDRWIRSDELLPAGRRDLLALHTPGHTQGHVVFVDRGERLLFAGDHVLPQITPSIGYEAVPSVLPLRRYLDSLSRVRELPDMTLLPAHGPVVEGTHQRIDELLSHHAERLDACEVVVGSGAATAFEVARGLRWTSRGRHFDDLDPFNQGLATGEAAVHLEVLAAEGRLRSERVEGVLHFAAPDQPTNRLACYSQPVGARDGASRRPGMHR